MLLECSFLCTLCDPISTVVCAGYRGDTLLGFGVLVFVILYLESFVCVSHTIVDVSRSACSVTISATYVHFVFLAVSIIYSTVI